MTDQQQIEILTDTIQSLEFRVAKLENMYSYYVEASATITSDLRNMIHDLKNGPVEDLQSRVLKLEQSVNFLLNQSNNQ